MDSNSEKNASAFAVTEQGGGAPTDPPGYPGLPETGPELSAELEASEQVVIPGYSHINLGKYHIPGSTMSMDKTTVTLLSKELSSNPTALEAFLEEQMKLPPRPTVRIVGRINGPVPIFDVRLDLFRHVSPSAERNGVWAHTKVSGMDDNAAPLRPDEKSALFSGAPDVTGAGFWIRRFCTDTTQPVRKFIFKRTVTNWDTDWLSAQIRALILSIGWRGPLEVTFPLHRATTVIQTPHQVNSFVTGLRGMFKSPKNYEVLTAVWPYATVPRSGDRELDAKQRECVLQDEEAWWNEWKDAIQLAVAGRRHGWVSVEDKVDAAMARPGMPPEKGAELGVVGGRVALR